MEYMSHLVLFVLGIHFAGAGNVLFSCDFESDCAWKPQNLTQELSWHFVRRPPSVIDTGPAHDHTSGKGKFAYLQPSHHSKQGDVATLTSPIISPGALCTASVTFYYNMYGSDIGSLSVKINGGPTVWTRSSQQHFDGTTWSKGLVVLEGDVRRGAKFKIDIVGTMGAGHSGDIGVDDVTVSEDCFTTLSTSTTTTTPTTTPTTTAGLAPNATGSSIYEHHDVTCHASYLSIAIPVTEAPNSELTMENKSCQLVNNGTHYVVQFAYDECGTNVTYYSDQVVSTNSISVHKVLDPNSPVVFQSDYVIPVTCSIPRSFEVTSSFQVVSRNPLREFDHVINVQKEFVLSEYRSEKFLHEVARSPGLVPLNEEAFFEIRFSDQQSHHSVGLSVTECRATPTTDPNDDNPFVLILYGCPKTRAVHILPRPGPDYFRFKVQAFHFPGHDTVYVHCDVNLCDDDNCDVKCDSLTRRKRRAQSYRKAFTTLTLGPYVFPNKV